MSDVASTSKAFRIARERASIAAYFEASTLHTAVYDAREAGMSVRETAAALQVSKSTVSRHWRGTKHDRRLPMWGSDAAWREAHAAIWAHDPDELADDFVPFLWNENDGTLWAEGHRARGVAVLRDGAVSADVARRPAMASPLADRASVGAMVLATVVAVAGFVPMMAGLVAAFVDGRLTNAFVPVGGFLTLIGALMSVGAVFFRRAHMRAVVANRPRQ